MPRKRPLPPWIQNLMVQAVDFETFMRVMMRELRPRWRALHPRKRSGPSTPLTADEVCEATATVLEGLTPDAFDTIIWKELITKVQDEVKKRRGKLYSAETIRKPVRDYVLQVFFFYEVPPKLLDDRQSYLKGGAKTPANRAAAFHRHQAMLPLPPPKKKT